MIVQLNSKLYARSQPFDCSKRQPRESSSRSFSRGNYTIANGDGEPEKVEEKPREIPTMNISITTRAKIVRTL